MAEDRKLVEVGDRHVFKGRVWGAIGVEPYTRKDGQETVLAVWQGSCTACGGPIVVRTPRLANLSKTNTFYTKRCRTCIDVAGLV